MLLKKMVKTVQFRYGMMAMGKFSSLSLSRGCQYFRGKFVDALFNIQIAPGTGAPPPIF
jgi:hypothetical protein